MVETGERRNPSSRIKKRKIRIEKTTRRNQKIIVTMKKHQAPIRPPIKEMKANPKETSLIKTYKGEANKIETLPETSLPMTFKEGVDREITPLEGTRGTLNKETIDPTMMIIIIIIIIMITKMITIENILQGRTKETLGDNPREAVTQ